MAFASPALVDIRSDLLPGLENKFGETFCRIEGRDRLFFKFSTEEHAICGLVAIREYLSRVGIPGLVIASGARTVTLMMEGV